jgi:cytochrome c
MKTVTLSIVVVSLCMSASAFADANLAAQKQCMGCHAVDKDGAGPAFKKIGMYWRGLKDAEARLVSTIRKGTEAGGAPHWGEPKMPNDSERPLVSEAEAKKLTKWILSLR